MEAIASSHFFGISFLFSWSEEKTDESVPLWSLLVGPGLYQTGQANTTPGHLYYAVFSVTYHCAVSFCPFLNYFCPQLNYLYWLLLFYCSLKKKKTFIMGQLCRMIMYWKELLVEGNRRVQTSTFKWFYFESAKRVSIYLVAGGSTVTLIHQTQKKKKNPQRLDWNMDFFHSSDSLLKLVLFVLISERQQSMMARGVERQWLNEVFYIF